MGGIKAILGVKELSDRKAGLYRALFAEFLGTLLLNFFGCGAVANKNNVVAISLAFGLTVAVVIQAIGHISGGHVNPAVTVGLAVVGKVPVIRAILYVIAQITGAIAGSAIVRALSTDSAEMQEFLGTVGHELPVRVEQALGVEFFLGLVLVLVVCGACDGAKPDSKGIAPIIIGFAVTVGHFVGIPRTGSGMNPARALGSAVIMGKLDNQWLYWVGPLLGGIAGALIYEHALGPAEQPEPRRQYEFAVTEEKERFEYIDSGRDEL
ncbi:aquaporin AQPAn.G-like isoform X2 [Neodiprion fabricii]|uniref:aquaporin AQPAn.G-like isoform X2 n=1 Tax=Neodiprion fabricii TaxID=2872261 RepID=UPI001ED9497D|nr:aquaporin AQPAn.G-like isoform X2 [Neodiprion fabricii]